MSEELLLLGDSVTVGTGFSGVDENTCYASVLRQELHAAGAEFRVTASALDGADTGYALRRFDRMVARLDPDVLVISLGLNDARPPGRRDRNAPEAYQANLETLTEKALDLDIKPVMCTPPPRLDISENGEPAWRSMSPYAERAREVAERYSLPLIELFEEFVNRDDLDALLPDRLHPGREGHRIIARQFAETLIPLAVPCEPVSLPSRRGSRFEFVAAD